MFEWWHWMVLGLFLAVTEIAVPTFFIIWFGIGAVGVGAALLIFPDLAISSQFLIWSATSVVLVLLWFRFFKPKTITAIGTSAANVTGEIGVLVSDLCPNSRGQVRFQKPVLGADSWEYYADSEIKAGERVCIVSVEGSFIKVEKAK